MSSGTLLALILKDKVLDLVTSSLFKTLQLEKQASISIILVIREWSPLNSLHPVLLINNAYALYIHISYRVTVIKYLPLWPIVSEECWPFSVSFLWSSWQTCMQVTEKINDYETSYQETWNPRDKSPMCCTTLWSQRCKVKLDSWITLSVQVSLSLTAHRPSEPYLTRASP